MRVALVLLACLGLVLPSAHWIALCIGCDGSIALEIAVDGTCAGAQHRSCCRTSCEEKPAAHKQKAEARIANECCRDVLLGRHATPPTVPVSTKRLSPRDDSDVAVAAQPAAGPITQAAAHASGMGSYRGMPPPPFLTTVVLLL
jgi:hypothetical protein